HRQARLIAQAIRDHTGVEVPVLGPARAITAFLLSLLLLGTMIAVALASNSPLVLLGWPAGVALIIFVFEIYPRAYCAHVLLRHVYEETGSPWMDPHRPFKPKDMEAKGEFLIQSFDELPLRWALNPKPYPANRQGVLN